MTSRAGVAGSFSHQSASDLPAGGGCRDSAGRLCAAATGFEHARAEVAVAGLLHAVAKQQVAGKPGLQQVDGERGLAWRRDGHNQGVRQAALGLNFSRLPGLAARASVISTSPSAASRASGRANPARRTGCGAGNGVVLHGDPRAHKPSPIISPALRRVRDRPPGAAGWICRARADRSSSSTPVLSLRVMHCAAPFLAPAGRHDFEGHAVGLALRAGLQLDAAGEEHLRQNRAA